MSLLSRWVRPVWTTDEMPVCILMRIHSYINGVLDADHDQPFKAFSDYRGEGHWPIVIQAFSHCRGFGDWDDGGGFHAG